MRKIVLTLILACTVTGSYAQVNQNGKNPFSKEALTKSFKDASNRMKQARQERAQEEAEEAYVEGRRFMRSSQMKDAAESFLIAAELGHSEAQAEIGKCYYYGSGVEKNTAEAVKWLRKAAENDISEAQALLGKCFYEGKSVTKNYAEAVKWFRKAANIGIPEAQYCLGLCYANGHGVQKSQTEAIKWYRMAAEQDYVDANYELGLCHLSGKGVSRSQSEAAKCFLVGANKRHQESQYQLAQLYQEGAGVTKSEKEAMSWYLMAANAGHADSQYALAILYEKAGKKYDASIWLNRAAEQGQKEAVAKVEADRKERASQVDLTRIYDMVEEMPSFPGGDEALLKWLGENFKYPEEDQKNGIQGRVTTSFVVERDGTISEVKTTRATTSLMAEEAIRLVKAMPKWNPGKTFGVPVRCRFNLPITFKL